MNKEEVYRYYGWSPSDGDYKAPVNEKKTGNGKFSLYAAKLYQKLLRVIMLRFF